VLREREGLPPSGEKVRFQKRGILDVLPEERFIDDPAGTRARRIAITIKGERDVAIRLLRDKNA
jgi:hypothetical protein